MVKLFAVLLISLPFTINAQTEADIIGTWIVTWGKQTPSNEIPPGNELMTLMIEFFKGSVWTFHQDKTFRIRFRPNIHPAMEEMKFLDNTQWKYISASKELRIGTPEDDYSYLIVTIKKSGTGIEAYFDDTPIYLTLQKQ
jgi:hypothetical protein